jgi:hypothetical protein
VFLNGQPVARFGLGWNPERVGAYEIRFPGGAVKAGLNRVELLAEAADPGPAATEGLPGAAVPDVPRFRLWYVRIRP